MWRWWWLLKTLLVLGVIQFFCLSARTQEVAYAANMPLNGSEVSLSYVDKKIKNFRSKDHQLVGLIIRRSIFENFSFRNSNLSGSKIQDSVFNGGDFIGVNFTDAFIADTQFTNCILPLHFKSEAILINVKIQNCRYQ